MSVPPRVAGWSLAHGGNHMATAATARAGLLGAALCLPLAALVRRPAPAVSSSSHARSSAHVCRRHPGHAPRPHCTARSCYGRCSLCGRPRSGPGFGAVGGRLPRHGVRAMSAHNSPFKALYPPFAWPRLAGPRRRHLSVAPAAAEETPTRAPGYVPWVAAVVAPYQDAGHATEFARLGWRRIAVELGPGLLPAGTAPQVHRAFTPTVVHDGLRHTVRQLSLLRVQTVVAGSPQAVPLAEQLAHELGVPGNDPSSTAARCDLAAQARALTRSRHHHAPDAAHHQLDRGPQLDADLRSARQLLTAADTALAAPSRVCRTEQESATPGRACAHPCPGAGAARTSRCASTYPGAPTWCTPSAGRATTTPPEHSDTDVWGATQTRAGALDRMDLMPRQELLWRALSLYTPRALRALQVSIGPVPCEVAYTPGHGPVLLGACAYPEVSAAARAVREALGSDPYRDAVHGAIVGRRRQPVGSAEPMHLARVPLRPTEDGHLDRWLLRTLTQLETVTHVDDALMPRVAVHGGVSPGELVLRHTCERAIEADTGSSAPWKVGPVCGGPVVTSSTNSPPPLRGRGAPGNGFRGWAAPPGPPHSRPTRASTRLPGHLPSQVTTRSVEQR
ncbi:hypothetical protein [Streptomyces sp. NBC_01445]|uniref:hypothetical protein n=1 Tax=Streptomyces sp. NBC_01445 TaxID=2903869 RepID=UPI002DD83A47|nr:hypothetical protein [Streptomyces sp. NBC_01445]WSE11540.1 hypothetical protein OG574_51120 [Streptomyces sp. NBC_01445]